MKDCKIKVMNAKQSREVQKKLFEMGVRWLGGEKVIKDYPTPLFLYISENELLWDSLKENVTVYKNLPELTVSELLKGESMKRYLIEDYTGKKDSESPKIFIVYAEDLWSILQKAYNDRKYKIAVSKISSNYIVNFS